ncbi:MAG: heavy-metal-associated domain-containing protein [Neisseriaceae bacterium]|nr:heavy-metal-associated domain-containing protein [Neisseriaceae bacterium]
MSTIQMTVLGMTCRKCVSHVTEALTDVAGVTSVNVDLENKSATVETDGSVTLAELTEAVVAEGYEVGQA